MTKSTDILKKKNNYLYLLKLLIDRDIKKKYKGSFLGILWSLVSPLLQMIVLTIIFSNLFSKSIENFPLYLIAGRLTFGFFSNATTKSMQSMIGSSSLIKKVYIPKILLTTSTVTSGFIIFIISLLDLAIVMLITGTGFTIYMLNLIPCLILLYLFVLGVSFILSVVNTIFRDIQHIYSIITMLIMYLSAIFYPVDIIPDQFMPLVKFNPIYQFIYCVRMSVYYAQPIETKVWLFCLIASLGTLLFGLVIFRRFEDKLVFYV